MYFQPYGDDQQLNLNWIINEIINLHKQLDPDYETPSFTQIYPFSNLNRLNLDWVLSELKALKELAPEPTPELDIQAVAVALVALPFDSTTSYQIYDFISKDGEIWRATEAIAAGGVWDETKWFKTKIGTDLAVLERWINAINNSLTSLQNTVDDLSSIDISDDSDAGGATVKASLNNLKGSLNSINDLNIKRSLNSSDNLDTLYGASASGVYYLKDGVQNSPAAWRPLLCLSDGGTAGGYQIIFGHNMLYARQRTGNPPSWSQWSSINVGMITSYNETGNTVVSRSYAINDIFLYGNDLYMAKTSISAGDAITSSNVDLLRLGNYINPVAVSGQLTDMFPDEGQAQFTHNTVRKQHNIALIDFRKYGMSPKAGNGVVAKLPEGFRPVGTCYCWGIVDVDGATSDFAPFEIRPSGDVYYYRTSAATTTGYWIVGTYPVA